MKKQNYIFALMVTVTSVICLLGISFKQTARADGNVSVTPILKNLPIQAGKGYFALQNTSNTYYEVPLIIRNDTDQTVKTVSTVNNAITADNGIISYLDAEAGNKDHDSLTKLLTTERSITDVLAPNSSKEISFGFKTNADQKIKLGGIVTQVKFGDNQGVSSNVDYVTAISVNGTNNRIDLKHLNLDKVNYQPNNSSLTVKINNSANQLIEKLPVKIKVSRNGKVVKQQQWKQTSMAPKSTTNYNVQMPDDLAPGKYQVRYETESNKQELKLNQTFNVAKVTQPKPKENRQSATFVVKIIIIMSGMLIAGGLGYYYLKHRK